MCVQVAGRVNFVKGKLSKEDIVQQLQKELSEANHVREQQLHEIARLKSSVEGQGNSMQVSMNKSSTSQINIRADNFEYDAINDTLNVIDNEALEKELEEHCTVSGSKRESKIKQMRSRVLSQVKNIERSKRGRTSSVCSVRSINSGVVVVRSRESDDESESTNKNP